MDDANVERIVVVGAHPDDVDFGCAGTTAQWTDQGIAVSYVIVTDGQAGGYDRETSRTDMARIRREEQVSAAAAVGVSDVRFLGYVDGELEVTRDLRCELARIIREVRPDRVVCQSPVRNLDSVYASHPDHLAAGEATLRAVYPDARNPFAFPELLDQDGLEPFSVPEVWLMGTSEPSRFVDITDTFDRKLAALMCHASQHPEPDTLEPRLREWNRANAELGDLGSDRLAESFRVVDTR